MALSKDEPRKFSAGQPAALTEIVMASGVTIYQGSAVGLTSDTARALNAADTFAGFCERQKTNASGGSTKAPIRTSGIVELAVASVAATNIGDTVYATDDNTFTLVASGGVAIGKVHEFLSSGRCLVKFEAVLARSL